MINLLHDIKVKDLAKEIKMNHQETSGFEGAWLVVKAHEEDEKWFHIEKGLIILLQRIYIVKITE